MKRVHWLVTWGTVAGACAVVVACSSSASGTGNGACANDYSGRWNLSGSCTNTTCDVTQSACSLTVRCDDGAQGTGTVTNTSATINGLLGTGDNGSCTVNFSGNHFSLQCNSSRSTQPCSGTGDCTSGSCGAPFRTGGTSGTSGSGGGEVPCTQKIGADTDSDCVGQAGKPRKLDCNASDTSTAVAAGCTPTKPGDSDVCCPLTVSGVPEGMSSGTSGTIDSGPTPITCAPTVPALFPPVAGKGPYCSGAPTATASHCALGEACCQDPTNQANPTTRVCAATCPAGKARIECYSAAECGVGEKCCGKGTPDADSCGYLVVHLLEQTICSPSCRTDEYVGCYSNTDCNGLSCKPAYVLNEAGTATVNVQVGVCR